jgi:hypothetical protein
VSVAEDGANTTPAARHAKLRRNADRLNEHEAAALEQFGGRHLAVSNGQVLPTRTPGLHEAWPASATRTTSRSHGKSRWTARYPSMRVEGRWHRFRDGFTQPVIEAAARTADGAREPAMMPYAARPSDHACEPGFKLSDWVGGGSAWATS